MVNAAARPITTTAGAVRSTEFNLTGRFLVLSLLCILVTSASSAYLLSRFLADNMLRRDAIVSMEFVNSLVSSVHAEKWFSSQDPAQRARAFSDLFSQIAKLPDVLRANIYSADRSILWSSSTELIDVEFSKNPELDRAIRGELIVHTGELGKVDKAEHAFLEGGELRFIENYLPIRDPESGNIIGVIEVYKSPTAVFAAIERGKRLVWLSALLGGAFLFCCLFWIVRRADSVIQEQQKRILDSEVFAAIGEMAMSVAHGLRNPLASIRSSAELSLTEDLNPRIRESLSDIVRQSDRLEGWIRELLLSAKPVSLELEKLELYEVLLQSVDVVREGLQRCGVELKLQGQRIQAPILGNAPALRQVFNSLMINAVEAMPDGGKLKIEMATSASDKDVVITIADTGHGISKENMDKVFAPYFTRKGKGIGVGLGLARRIVERHEGSLRIKQSTPYGTILEVRIPMRNEE